LAWKCRAPFLATVHDQLSVPSAERPRPASAGALPAIWSIEAVVAA